MLKVLFATQRLNSTTNQPEYQEYISIVAKVADESNFWSLDIDNNGLGDAWETAQFGRVGNHPNADPDHDGLTNLQEYLTGKNPNVFDNNAVWTLAIVEGNNRGGLPSAVMAPPLTVRLANGVGQPQQGATVSFAILSGGGSLQSIQGVTNVNGIAKATLKLPSTVGAVVKIRARTTIESVNYDRTFTATVGNPSEAPAPPSQPWITLQTEDTEAVIEWQDDSHNETAFYVERTEDNISWTRRATLAPNTTTYTDTGLDPETVYIYRVISHNNAP